MATERLARQKVGAIISASMINAAIDAVESASRVTVAGPLQMTQGQTGTLISNPSPRTFPAKLLSGSGVGPYTYLEQLYAPGGGFTDGFISGSDAYNKQGGITITLPSIVDMEWTTAGEMRFSIGSC